MSETTDANQHPKPHRVVVGGSVEVVVGGIPV